MNDSSGELPEASVNLNQGDGYSCTGDARLSAQYFGRGLQCIPREAGSNRPAFQVTNRDLNRDQHMKCPSC